MITIGLTPPDASWSSTRLSSASRTAESTSYPARMPFSRSAIAGDAAAAAGALASSASTPCISATSTMRSETAVASPRTAAASASSSVGVVILSGGK